MNKDPIDYLIVGGGIAGAVLALQLAERGLQVSIYDKVNEMSASRVAAGIINPVTGQRFVKSWIFDQLIDAATAFYSSYDQKWNTDYFKHTLINRALFSKNEITNFENREGDEHYEPYFSKQDATERRHFRESGEWCAIKGARLDLGGFVNQAKEYLSTKGHAVYGEQFDFNQLELEPNGLVYKGDRYSKMVCCEGIGILNNPYFQELPMVPAKGECLLVEIPSIDTIDIYKHKTFFVPLNDQNLFWVGSNYDWDFDAADPTEKGYEWILGKVKESIKVPFNVKQHIAAIRPTGKDRRPYLGHHPKHQNIFIFNALGTKGSSLAPYWAKELVSFMEDQKALIPEVNITRFELT